MNFAAVFHRAQAPYSYALNPDELVLRLQTGPEVERVFLHWGDPFEAGILGGAERWKGQRQEITGPLRLEHCLWWSSAIRPPYKRAATILSCIRAARSGSTERTASAHRSKTKKRSARRRSISPG